jgi:hypothetical protein
VLVTGATSSSRRASRSGSGVRRSIDAAAAAAAAAAGAQPRPGSSSAEVRALLASNKAQVMAALAALDAPPSSKEVEEYARYLGLNPVKVRGATLVDPC